jgi:hypothetical protein
MQSGGARTLSDLVIEGHERVVIGCAKCNRTGSYGLGSLIVRYGIDQGLLNLLAELSADCPKRAGFGLDRSGVTYLTGSQGGLSPSDFHPDSEIVPVVERSQSLPGKFHGRH